MDSHIWTDMADNPKCSYMIDTTTHHGYGTNINVTCGNELSNMITNIHVPYFFNNIVVIQVKIHT